MSEAPLRKGWCPGARRPMPAKDGLLVRLRISGGIVGAATASGLAQAGRDHGNGLFDLSARGNLQIRGVRESSLPALIETLDRFGLVDEDAETEAVRNVLLSPLAGLDGRSEAGNAAKALEAMLATEKALHALPAKFSFLIDDGSSLSLGPTPADIRFDWTEGTQSFAIGIGGHTNEAIFLGHCGGDAIAAIASRLALAFLRLGSSMAEPPRRMRGLIESCGAHEIAKGAGLCLAESPRREAFEEPCPIGLMRFHDKYCFGVGAAFGSLDANMLEAVATASERFGTGEIRLTPWRALILPHVRSERADAISTTFATHNFIVDREDLRLAVAACGGALSCEHGTADTRSDALALMFFARQLCKTGVALHVSGCAKVCARQAAAPLTLIAHEGLYDLVTEQIAHDAGISKTQRLSVAAVRDILATIAGNGSRLSELGTQ
ncbi:MAG TPA: precorrin-3B synthase [Methylocella sp.]|nr:precorrin-3B synthase [Methylocella sp.]